MFSETIKLVCKIYLFQAKADGKYSEKIKKNIYFMLSSLNFTPEKLFVYPYWITLGDIWLYTSKILNIPI